MKIRRETHGLELRDDEPRRVTAVRAGRSFQIVEAKDIGFGFEDHRNVRKDAKASRAQSSSRSGHSLPQSKSSLGGSNTLSSHGLAAARPRQNPVDRSLSSVSAADSVPAAGVPLSRVGALPSRNPVSSSERWSQAMVGEPSVPPRAHAPGVSLGSQGSQGFQASQMWGALADAVATPPSRWSVLLGICVDAALCFALLAASQAAVVMGGWDRILQQLVANPQVKRSLEAVAATLGHLLEGSGVASPGPEGLAHVGLVLVAWVLAVGIIQFFCVTAWRATLGRALAGIRVNPSASKGLGRFGIPFFEVLTFGGLFTLPVALLSPEKHVFLSRVRYQSH